MGRFTFLLLAAVVAACATTPYATGDPRVVAVVESSREVGACEDLGMVIATLGFDSRYEPPQAAIQRVVEDLQIQTVSAGGDTLWLQHVDLRPTEVRGGGHAYRCRQD